MFNIVTYRKEIIKKRCQIGYNILPEKGLQIGLKIRPITWRIFLFRTFFCWHISKKPYLKFWCEIGRFWCEIGRQPFEDLYASEVLFVYDPLNSFWFDEFVSFLYFYSFLILCIMFWWVFLPFYLFMKYFLFVFFLFKSFGFIW